MVATSLVFALGSSLAVAALPAQQPLTGVTFDDSTDCTPKNPLIAAETYYGTGRGETDKVRLRISNGGAGLSGLVGALANEFINYMVDEKGEDPFAIEWLKGDTTETINYLGTGQADIGITYNKAAECQAMSEVADRRVYGFRDHFFLVGPPSNPAGLNEYKKGGKNENVLTQFQKIVRTGNNPDPKQEFPTRFLSRYDKSATNIKDSELFVTIGQVPWGLAYSKWYHQYTMYPGDALKAAALLNEYTITDRGTWLSTDEKFTSLLVRYNEGSDEDEIQGKGGKTKRRPDLLLNPGFFLTSTKICTANKKLANEFLDWTTRSEHGQKVIDEFRGKDGSSKEWLYTRAPTQKTPIHDCD